MNNSNTCNTLNFYKNYVLKRIGVGSAFIDR